MDALPQFGISHILTHDNAGGADRDVRLVITHGEKSSNGENDKGNTHYISEPKEVDLGDEAV